MSDLLRQILGELVHIRQEQTALRKIAEEQGTILREHGTMLKQHGEALKDLQLGMRQLNENMGQIARFVAEDRAKQNREIEEIKRRIDVLERKAA